MALACFSPLHVDRLVSFYKATLKTGRTFVADPYTALVLHQAAKHCKVPDPAIERKIRVYYTKDFEDSYEAKGLVEVYKKFMPNRICMQELRGAPEKYLMVFRPRMLNVDFEDDLPKSSLCIYPTGRLPGTTSVDRISGETESCRRQLRPSPHQWPHFCRGPDFDFCTFTLPGRLYFPVIVGFSRAWSS